MRGIVRSYLAPLAIVSLLAACGGQSTGGAQEPSVADQAPEEDGGQAAAPARGRGGGEPAAAEPAQQQDGPASGEALPVGLAAATTGSAALLGQEEVFGAEIAEELLNAQGGVAGRPIDVVVQDTGGSPDGGRAAFETLINSARVVGIVGPTLTQQATAAAPLANQYGVPVLGAAAGLTGSGTGGNFLFRVSPPTREVAPSALDVAIEENPEIARVALAFAEDDAASSSETVAFQQAVQERGLSISTVQTFETTDTSFAPPAAAIVETAPDLVVVSGLTTDGGSMVRQLRESGYEGPIVAGNGLNTAEVIPVCQAACQGVLIAQTYSPQTENAINEAFRSSYEQRHGRLPSQPSAQAFTAVQVLVEGLRRVAEAQDVAGLDLGTMRIALNDAISVGEYETPLGLVSFTTSGDIDQEQFHVARIEMSEDGRTGRFVIVR